MAVGLVNLGLRLSLTASLLPACAEDLVLGILSPTTSVSNIYLAVSIAFDIDFRKNYQDSLKRAYGDPIIAISNLHPDLRLKTLIGTSNSEIQYGMQTTIDWVMGTNGATRVTGIVGGDYSALDLALASLSAVFHVPQVSWASTSPSLSNKRAYPYFMRAVPPDSIQGAAMWRFVTSYRIPCVTFVYSEEPYGAGLFAAVSEVASNDNQAFRLTAVSVPYMPINYDTSRARELINRAMNLNSRFVYLGMGPSQFAYFMPVAKAEGLFGTDWQVAGSEALADFEKWDLPVGYMYFAGINRGPLFSRFLRLWTMLTLDDIYGLDVQAHYGIDRFVVPLAGQTASTLSQTDFANGDSLLYYSSFLFDAGYAFILATNNLLNAGISMANITGQTLLDALKVVQFEGISGHVAFDANGDRLAFYQINNVQKSGGTKVSRVATIYNSVNETFAMEDGVNLYWMDGNPSATVPDYLKACRPGYSTQAETGLCLPCAPGTYSLGGINATCLRCPAGRYQDETGQTDCNFFEIQLGILAPITSVSSNFLAAAIMFDLDFRKNHENELRLRFGEPIVPLNNLNDNLRIKVQVANSDSNPDVGVGSAFDLFQGQNGVDQIVGLVGGFHSTVSVPVASLATRFKCPQVSWGSTAPVLSNKDAYPYFLRTIPSDLIQGGGMWKFIEAFRVPFATFLYSQEPYGEGLFQSVQGYAEQVSQSFRLNGVGIRHMPTNYVYDEAVEALRKCKATGAKVIFLVMGTDQGRAFFPVAAQESLLTLEWQLIGSEALPASISPVTPVGYIWFSPVTRGRLFSRFQEMWKTLTRSDIEGAAALAYYNIDQWPVPLNQSAATAVHISDDTFASVDGLEMEVPMLFDAAYAFAIAFNSLLNTGTAMSEIKEEVLLKAVKAVQFEGISGPVSFDTSGDRMTSCMILNKINKRLDSLVGVNQSFVVVVAAMYSAITGAITNADNDSQPIEILWMTETVGSILPSAFTACEPGFYKDVDSLMCMKCIEGEYSMGGEDALCRRCPQGKAAECTMEGERCIGATGCRKCTAGKSAENSGSTMCKSCPLGMYSASEAATACQRCDLGTWQNELGSTGCQSCAQNEGTWYMAAESPAECVCNLGFYREMPGGSCSLNFSSLPPAGSPNRSKCVPCPESMSCEFGSDMLHYWKWYCLNSTMFPFPTLDASYMSLGEEPLTVFQCNLRERCPGGPPGTCGKALDVTIRTCSFCQDGWSWTTEECVKCTDFEKSGIAILASFVIGMLCLGILTFLVNRDVVSQPRAATSCILLIGLSFGSLQTLGIFVNMDVDWPEPLKTQLAGMHVLNFDLNILKSDCVLGAGVVRSFMVRQMVAPTSVCFMAIMIMLKHRRSFDRVRYVVDFMNTSGCIFQVMFIPMAVSAWLPFVCFEHPGKHASSMTTSPSVLCFGGDDSHSAMVVISVFVCLLCLLPYLAFVIYGIGMHWRFVLDAQVNKGHGLRMYRFLFCRFRPPVYYYGSIILARNLLMCLVPVVTNHGATQIFVQAIILIAGIVLQLSLQPWLSTLTNWMDGVLGGCMVLVLLCAAMTTSFGSVEDLIGILGVTAIGCCILGILVSLCFTLYRYLRPHSYYSKFICHHKADAAAQARFLQMVLQANTGKPVFLDSDHLTDLSKLFDIVRSRIGQLVVLLTASTLRRPWCVGEITVSYSSHRSVYIVRMPCFREPTKHDMSNLGSYIDMGSMDLGEYGITMHRVAEAVTWLLSGNLPVVEPKAVDNGSAILTGVVSSVLGNRVERYSVQTRRHTTSGVILISSDPADVEATAAASILCMKLQEDVINVDASKICMLVDEAEVTEKTVAEAASTAKAVIMMFSRNSMQSASQLCALAVTAMRLRLDKSFQVVPVSTPSFNFPDGAYWSETFPCLRPDADNEASYIKSIFKLIFVVFNTSASNQILHQEALEVLTRIRSKRGTQLDVSEEVMSTRSVRLRNSLQYDYI